MQFYLINDELTWKVSFENSQILNRSQTSMIVFQWKIIKLLQLLFSIVPVKLSESSCVKERLTRNARMNYAQRKSQRAIVKRVVCNFLCLTFFSLFFDTQIFTLIWPLQ